MAPSSVFTSEPFAIFHHRCPTESERRELKKNHVRFIFTDYWYHEKHFFEDFDPVFRINVGTTDPTNVIQTIFPKETVGELVVGGGGRRWLDITDERVFRILFRMIDVMISKLKKRNPEWHPKIELVNGNLCGHESGFEVDCRDQVYYLNRFVQWFRMRWQGSVVITMTEEWTNAEWLQFDALRMVHALEDARTIMTTDRPIFHTENCGNSWSAFFQKRLYRKWKKNHPNHNILGMNLEDGTNYYHL